MCELLHNLGWLWEELLDYKLDLRLNTVCPRFTKAPEACGQGNLTMSILVVHQDYTYLLDTCLNRLRVVSPVLGFSCAPSSQKPKIWTIETHSSDLFLFTFLILWFF